MSEERYYTIAKLARRLTERFGQGAIQENLDLLKKWQVPPETDEQRDMVKQSEEVAASYAKDGIDRAPQTPITEALAERIMRSWIAALKLHIRKGKLQARDPATLMPCSPENILEDFHIVGVDDVNRLFEKSGLPYSLHSHESREETDEPVSTERGVQPGGPSTRAANQARGDQQVERRRLLVEFVAQSVSKGKKVGQHWALQWEDRRKLPCSSNHVAEVFFSLHAALQPMAASTIRADLKEQGITLQQGAKSTTHQLLRNLWKDELKKSGSNCLICRESVPLPAPNPIFRTA